MPVTAVVFGSVTPPQGDVIDLRVHLGCTKEVSSFSCLLQNFGKKYSPGGTSPINVGDNGSISIGRGSNYPLIITLRIEEIRCESTSVQNYIRVRGRCWGEKLFRRVVTKKYENQKGEAIVKDLLDSYVGLSHVRNTTELVENTDTTYTLLEYENTPVFDILKYIAGSADKAGVIGFDFRVDWDGKFAFFPRNSKTSPISLSELIESSVYRKDIHRIRNKITVFGAAEKAHPEDKDYWTDGAKDQWEADDAEDSHQNGTYQLVATVVLDPASDKKVQISRVQLEARVANLGEAAYWRATYQKEGGAETEICTDQYFTNTTYELKTYDPSEPIFGDLGKDVTIRFYTRVYNAGVDTVYSRNHRARYNLFQGDWTSGTGTGSVALDSAEEIVGTYCIRHTTNTSDYYGCLFLSLASAGIAVDCNKYPSFTFQIKLQSAFSGHVTVQLEEYHDGTWQVARREITIEPGADWSLQSFSVGEKNRDEWTYSPFNTKDFDWRYVQRILWYCHFPGTGTGSFWVDNLFFNKRRWEATRQNSASQSSYGLRELVEVDEELHSDNECDLRAKALLAHLKDPAEYITVRSTVIDYGTNKLLPGDKIHVTLPNENIDADFRIVSVEYHVIAAEQTLEITLELGKETPLLADYLFKLRSKSDSLARYKRGW